MALVENPLTATYPYHLMLLCTLLCSALIEFDGHRPPVRLFIPAMIVGFVTPVIWPTVLPGFCIWPDPVGTASRYEVAAHLGVGILVGVIVGLETLAKRWLGAKSESNIAWVSAGQSLRSLCPVAFFGMSGVMVLMLATSVMIILLPVAWLAAAFGYRSKRLAAVVFQPAIPLLIVSFAWIAILATRLASSR